MVPTSSQDEALAHYSVSGEVSVLTLIINIIEWPFDKIITLILIPFEALFSLIGI